VAQEHQQVTIQIALIYDWVIFEVLKGADR
jgi:hypothetical protein